MGVVRMPKRGSGIDLAKLQTGRIYGNMTSGTSTGQVVFSTLTRVKCVIYGGTESDWGSAYSITAYLDITLDGTTWTEIVSATSGVTNMPVLLAPAIDEIPRTGIMGIRVRLTGVAVQKRAGCLYFYQ